MITWSCAGNENLCLKSCVEGGEWGGLLYINSNNSELYIKKSNYKCKSLIKKYEVLLLIYFYSRYLRRIVAVKENLNL